MISVLFGMKLLRQVGRSHKDLYCNSNTLVFRLNLALSSLESSLITGARSLYVSLFFGATYPKVQRGYSVRLASSCWQSWSLLRRESYCRWNFLLVIRACWCRTANTSSMWWSLHLISTDLQRVFGKNRAWQWQWLWPPVSLLCVYFFMSTKVIFVILYLHILPRDPSRR